MPVKNIYGIALTSLVLLYLAYSFWLYTRPEKHTIVNPEKFAAGKMVWQEHNCHICHQVYGLGGYLGPDLTNVYSFRGRSFISAFVQNGTQVMPAFHLPDADLDNLLYFLSQIDSTGNGDPRTFKINPDGTIREP